MIGIKLLPRNFPEMNIFDQINSMIDVFGIVMKISGDTQFKENIEMLEEVKKECYRRNSSINIFDLMGDQFTKEYFHQIKADSS
jgi:hypothetical protein